MLQDDVAVAELGAVNGVQGSLCAAFEMASFVAGLALRTPQDFAALMAASCAAVALSAAVLARFAMMQRAPDAAAASQKALDGSGDSSADGLARAGDTPRELQPLAAERTPLLQEGPTG